MAGLNNSWLQNVKISSKTTAESELQTLIEAAGSVELFTDTFGDGGNESTERVLSEVEIWKYVGFNPVEIMKIILKKGELLYPNAQIRKTSVQMDMSRLCTFAACRTMNSKKLGDLPPNAAAMFKQLTDKWGITNSPKGTDGQSLTLSRVCSVYPMSYVKALLCTGNWNKFGVVEGLEPMYHHSLAAAYIPRNSWGVNQMTLWLSWNENFSNAINSGRIKSEAEEAARKTTGIVRLQYTNGNPEDTRIRYSIIMASVINKEPRIKERAKNVKPDIKFYIDMLASHAKEIGNVNLAKFIEEGKNFDSAAGIFDAQAMKALEAQMKAGDSKFQTAKSGDTQKSPNVGQGSPPGPGSPTIPPVPTPRAGRLNILTSTK